MDDLLREFLTESTESLSTLDVQLVKLEQNPNDPELVGSIFRLFHTIKGTCGFLGLPRLESVAHAAENVLGKIRDGQLQVTTEGVSLILTSIDRIKSLLGELEATETEGTGDDKELIARLHAFERGETLAESAATDQPGKPETHAEKASLFERLGGAAAVNAAVQLFYDKVLADSSLTPFFENVDSDHLRRQQSTFLTKALGGPDNYAGRDLSSAHARLVDMGLSEQHFDTVAAHFQATLQELSVPEDLIAEAIAIVATTADAVLNRDAQKAAAAKTEAAPKAPVAAKPSKDVAPAEGTAKAGGEGGADGSGESGVANQTIRVSVQLLESLMTTVSELVLTRNQLLQMVRAREDSEFKAPLQRLSHITSDLQEGVMKTRMQPIGNAWGKLPRIVRTLTHDLGKKIELEMIGAETELDRQVLELIKDPLTHMVRNSGDHGLEMPAERKAAGKPETGRIRLNAYHEGGHIIIEVSDDGRGIDLARVRAKILANGLATEAELEGMTEQQVLQFVFRAGFSTAEKVTNVSGRGVGMDVVRTNIEKIGGTIDMSTTQGKGTKFTIKIPLTLAIVSTLIVEAGGERFAVPQISVIELVRTKEDSDHKIEVINGTPVLRLRNRLLPLVSLADLLGLSPKELADTPKAEKAGASLYKQIGGAAALRAAVDLFYTKVLDDPLLQPFFANAKMEWLKKQQIAFLTSALGGPDRYRGADLRTAHARLVEEGLAAPHFDAVAKHLKATLDELKVPGELTAKVMAVAASTRNEVLNIDEVDDAAEDTSQSFIVVTQVGAYTFGIIVDRVFDTEEIVVKPVSPILRNVSMFSGNTILGDGSVIMILDPNGIAAAMGKRHAGDHEMAEASATKEMRNSENVALLVFRAGNDTPKAVPLSLVARLEEIATDSIETSDGRPVVQYRGRLMPLVPVDGGQAVRKEGRQPVIVFADGARNMGLLVDEIIDIIEDRLNFEVSSKHANMLGTAVIGGKATEVIDVASYLSQGFGDWFKNQRSDRGHGGRRLLLVDDSPFFRNMLMPVLKSAGYDVTVVADADEALKLRDEGADFDVIVSDIEMPGMDGFSFVKTCRSDGLWQQVPMVALSSHTEPHDFERGREAGFNDYVAKFDRAALITALRQTLEMAGSAA
jgi:chemotaxis protein histidine kinase CheA